MCFHWVKHGVSPCQYSFRNHPDWNRSVRRVLSSSSSNGTTLLVSSPSLEVYSITFSAEEMSKYTVANLVSLIDRVTSKSLESKKEENAETSDTSRTGTGVRAWSSRSLFHVSVMSLKLQEYHSYRVFQTVQENWKIHGTPTLEHRYIRVYN